jgi:hypothetical protein
MKKFGIGALALILGLGTTTLTGCGKDKDPNELQIMNLSVNPGVEFVIDEDDKVLSVTASNEDGAFLLEKFTEFTGMSAKDAALKFIEISEEYGFVVSGTVNNESISISISGEGAEKLYNDVKGKISSKVSELGMTIDQLVEISNEELETIVQQCYQEYTTTEIENMSDEKILELIKQSREETKGIHTEQERLEYYKERAEKILEAKIDAIKEYIDNNADPIENVTLTPLVTAIDMAYSAIETAYSAIDTQLQTMFSNIETQMNAYVTDKERYLDSVEAYRDALEANADTNPDNNFTPSHVEELKTTMVNLKNQAKDLYDTLDTARQYITENMMNLIHTTIHTHLTTLNNAIDAVLEKISLSMDTMQTEVQSAIEALKDEYERNSISPWTQQD